LYNKNSKNRELREGKKAGKQRTKVENKEEFAVQILNRD